MHYTVEDKELELLIPSDDILRAELEKFKELNEVWELDEEDEDKSIVELAVFLSHADDLLEDSQKKLSKNDPRSLEY